MTERRKEGRKKKKQSKEGKDYREVIYIYGTPTGCQIL